MKTRIIAIDPYDGWAFIAKGKKIFLLRPPYTPSNLSEVSENVVANAVGKYGFEECDIAFDSTDEIIKFLEDQLVQSRKRFGIDLPSSTQLRELLKYFDDSVLLEYLRRAQEELIPEGNLEAAESIALDIIGLEKERTNPEMKRMAMEILQKCRQTGKQLEEDLRKARTIARKIVNNSFPNEIEYFDFLFDLIVREIGDLEPGKEMEFLREIWAVHPMGLGYTSIVITVSVALLCRGAADAISEDMIKKKIEDIIEEANEKEILAISKYPMSRYLREEKNRRMVNEE